MEKTREAAAVSHTQGLETGRRERARIFHGFAGHGGQEEGVVKQVCAEGDGGLGGVPHAGELWEREAEHALGDAVAEESVVVRHADFLLGDGEPADRDGVEARGAQQGFVGSIPASKIYPRTRANGDGHIPDEERDVREGLERWGRRRVELHGPKVARRGWD
jgi:hypothetical protein